MINDENPKKLELGVELAGALKDVISAHYKKASNSGYSELGIADSIHAALSIVVADFFHATSDNGLIEMDEMKQTLMTMIDEVDKEMRGL